MTSAAPVSPAQAAVGPKDRPAWSAGLLIAALLVLSVQDALIKHLSDAVSLWQFQLLRSVMNLGLLALAGALVLSARATWPLSLRAVALRSVVLTTTMCLFFAGIPFLTLSEIAAGLYCFPLFVTLMNLFLPGEHVGWRRLSAVAVGFAGTLLVLKPGTESFEWVALLPLGAAVCYAANVLITRRLCRQEHPATLALGVVVAFVGLSLPMVVIMPLAAPPGLAAAWPYVFGGWQEMGLVLLGLIFVCALMNLGANVALSFAYQNAESSWLAPFDYVYLVFAAVVGGVVFGDWPEGFAILGMSLIAGAGVFIALREGRSYPAKRV
ncbi:MAG: DMT family transporter [Pseudomonadota bacterium]